MAACKPIKLGTAVLMSVSIFTGAATPVLLSAPGRTAQPQLFSQSGQVRVATGSAIAVSYDEGERILLKPDETMAVTLTVAEDVRSAAGTILIPRGSQIEGELRPTGQGTQFVAETLILKNGQRYSLDATSGVVTRREKLRKDASTSTILQGAAIGAAASAILSELFGDIGFIKVLAGTGAGALGGYLLGRRSVEVVVVEPEQDLDLTLNSDLVLR